MRQQRQKKNTATFEIGKYTLRKIGRGGNNRKSTWVVRIGRRKVRGPLSYCQSAVYQEMKGV